MKVPVRFQPLGIHGEALENETILDVARFRKLPDYLKALFRDELVAFRIREDPEGGYRMRLFFHLLAGCRQRCFALR